MPTATNWFRKRRDYIFILCLNGWEENQNCFFHTIPEKLAKPDGNNGVSNRRQIPLPHCFIPINFVIFSCFFDQRKWFCFHFFFESKFCCTKNLVLFVSSISSSFWNECKHFFLYRCHQTSLSCGASILFCFFCCSLFSLCHHCLRKFFFCSYFLLSTIEKSLKPIYQFVSSSLHPFSQGVHSYVYNNDESTMDFFKCNK